MILYIFFFFFLLLLISITLTSIAKLIEFRFFFAISFYYLFDFIKRLKILDKYRYKSLKSFGFITTIVFYYFLG